MFLEHVNLTVSDLERSIDFYCRLFDYRVRWRGETTDGMPAAHVGDERHYLALFETQRTELAAQDYHRVGLNHFGFVVADLQAAKERLEALGVAPTMEADYHPGRRLYFLDPDAVEVELVDYGAGATDEETA